MTEFSKLSYRGQVRRFRQLALAALSRYPIQHKKIKFINYGENTTFQITDKKGKEYLLRICRSGYHTEQGLLEELHWLRKLDQTNKFQLPAPVLSKNKKLLVRVATPGIPEGRNVILFKWISGRFLEKNITEKHMQAVGLLTAQLHQHSFKKVLHRRYWTAEGLLGVKAKFSNIDKLASATVKQQKIITQARKKNLRLLKKFEKRYPQRMGYIHADLHTGNFFFNSKGIAVIDFDDSGLGFFGYDVVIPLMSLERFKLSRKRKIQLTDAFFTGYRQIRTWDRHDEKMQKPFMVARRLMILGWLNLRTDNPRLRKYLAKSIRKTVRILQSRSGA